MWPANLSTAELEALVEYLDRVYGKPGDGDNGKIASARATARYHLGQRRAEERDAEAWRLLRASGWPDDRMS